MKNNAFLFLVATARLFEKPTVEKAPSFVRIGKLTV